jgi:MoxR-like ATPase
MPRANVVLKHEEIIRLIGVVRDVPIAPHVERYAAQLLHATHPGTPGAPEIVRQYVKYGASPRGLQALILGGKVRALLDSRFNVSVEDIKQVSRAALRHRLLLNFEGEAEEIKTDDIIRKIVESIPVEA